MNRSRKKVGALVLLCMAAVFAPVVFAQEGTATGEQTDYSGAVSPEAQAVMDRMTSTLQGLSSFSVDTTSSRDELVALGYKIQNNESATLLVQRPDKLRSEVTGDVRNRSFVYDGKTLVMYAPDENAFVRVPAPDTLGSLLGRMLDDGIEMPLIDVLYQATAGTLTDWVRGGVLVGTSTIDGIECDQLAFRQASIDWQIWVEKGARALPRKILITTRYEVGEPQYEANLRWNLKPKIDRDSFTFKPREGATEIPLDVPLAATAASTP